MMNATKFVKLKHNFPKLRPTVKVDKLHKIQKVSEQICSEMILIHNKSEHRVKQCYQGGWVWINLLYCFQAEQKSTLIVEFYISQSLHTPGNFRRNMQLAALAFAFVCQILIFKVWIFKLRHGALQDTFVSLSVFVKKFLNLSPQLIVPLSLFLLLMMI